MRNTDEDHAFELFRQHKLDTLTEEEFDQRKYSMNIDYAAIIEQANKRKEILQNLTELVKDAPCMLEHLMVLTEWAKNIRAEYKDLDYEGRMLVPSAYRGTFDDMEKVCERLGQLNRYGSSGISRFVTGE